MHDVDMEVRNIGGIDETSMRISSGVTALVGENATNRTSLIQAIAAGLGTDKYTLKSDAEVGEVSMTVGDQTYVREIRRENNHVETEGNPYLDEPDIAELYGVLLESNEIRRAARRGENLRELILSPVDTEQIQDEIGERVDRRREIDRELDRLDALADRRTELEADRRRKQEEVADLEARIEEKRGELDALDEDNADQGDSDELAEQLERLRETRAELERVSANLESERKSLERLEENRETIADQQDSLEPPDDAEIARLEERIEGLRNRRRSLESTISELQRVIQFNDERLAESQSGVRNALDEKTNGGSPADGLDPSSSAVTCWTCGSEVERGRIEETVERLQKIRQDKSREKNQIAAELDDLSCELEDHKTRREESAELADRLETLAEKIDQREETIDELETRRESLRERVDTLEASVERLQNDQQDELLALQQEVSELTFNRDQAVDDLESLEAEIEEIEAELATREELQARRETLSEELNELRTRIDRIEREAIEEFNTHMEAIIDRLGYDNIGRIWLERTEEEVKKGRGTATEKRFELHVVREDEAGGVYEDSISHLSESEREIVGLVVALSGYLVHDVHEEVPFMLLDSIEMIDGNRLVDLILYLEEFVPYLVVVLLPDHARAFKENTPSEGHKVVEI
ncbi:MULTISPECIES: archaea-specific SMC-related protein [Salinibaculum]|uniref:archaea-specific SMC-related protein n=1 Tax=Salinibaculum TaxID=2732368 RepID=UPI0030D278B9